MNPDIKQVSMPELRVKTYIKIVEKLHDCGLSLEIAIKTAFDIVKSSDSKRLTELLNK